MSTSTTSSRPLSSQQVPIVRTAAPSAAEPVASTRLPLASVPTSTASRANITAHAQAAPAQAPKRPRAPAAPPVPPTQYPNVDSFLRGSSNEVRFNGKTITAFDCGGEVFCAKRGKSIEQLLSKFEQYLVDNDGELHNFDY